MNDNNEAKAKKPLNVLMSIIFYPRGGSAQVVRYLSQSLINLGHRVHLLTGSLDNGDPQHDASIFYEGLPVTTVDYTEAWHGFNQGRNPISSEWATPFHPSYEDKLNVPDRVFYKVNQTEYPVLHHSWTIAFENLKQHFQPDIIHLHHLNHMHLAAAEEFPSTPMATQLHGTELKMLEHLDKKGKESSPYHNLHEFWTDIFSKASEAMQHTFAISPDIHKRAVTKFSINENNITTIPNGVDISIFKPLDWAEDEKISFLRKILVDEPKGWDETCEPGSIAYYDADMEKFRTEQGTLKPLLMFVGRFLDFKRVPLLVEAVAKVNQMFEKDENWPPFNLLVWGGMPCEWEGQHPYTQVRELGLPNVFFCGWLPHSLLTKGLNIADVFVAPSYYEPFGQVFLEAMATRLPVIATRSGGPLSFVVGSGSKANGWLCSVDNVDSLADSIYKSLTSEPERKRRGINALKLIRSKYDWLEIANKYVTVYRQLEKYKS